MAEITRIGLGISLGELQNSEPDLEIVGLLTQMLEDAKSGKIRAVAVAGVSNLGEFLNATAGQTDITKIIGAMEIVKFRLMMKNVGNL